MHKLFEGSQILREYIEGCKIFVRILPVGL